MNYSFKKFDTEIKTVAPYNHHSLQASHSIRFLSTMLMKHLTGLGQILTKYNAYELTFCRKPKLLLDPDTNPDIKVSSTLK